MTEFDYTSPVSVMFAGNWERYWLVHAEEHPTGTFRGKWRGDDIDYQVDP